MKKLRFSKDASGEWYIDLPEWEGSRAELLMVAGADTLLDVISGNGNSLCVNADLREFPGATRLTLQRMGDAEGGGYYFAGSYKGEKLDLELWLCDVTRFVFGYIPPEIYISPC